MKLRNRTLLEIRSTLPENLIGGTITDSRQQMPIYHRGSACRHHHLFCSRKRCVLPSPVVLVKLTTQPAYMSYYYLLLWDRDRRAAITIWLLYFITYLPGGALAFKSVADYYSKFTRDPIITASLTDVLLAEFVHYEPLVNGCYVTQQPVLMKGFWSFLVGPLRQPKY